jgi:hypothetical protein
MFRRRPILTTLLLLALVTGVALAIFVATFDLNSYRERLQTSLSAALSQPVHLGAARLSLRYGPALTFTDLRIGAGDGESNLLRAKSLALRPALRPLLRGELIFDRIVLDAPHYSHVVSPSDGKEGDGAPRPPFFDQGMVENTLIRNLTIHNGAVHIIDRRDPERPRTLSLENLELQGDDLTLHRPSGIRLKGRMIQNGTSAPFLLEAGIIPGAAPRRWQTTELNLSLSLQNLEPESILEEFLPGIASRGDCSLRLGLGGIPATGLVLTADLKGKDLALILPGNAHPIPLQTLALQATWHKEQDRQVFSGITLLAPGISARGELTLGKKDGISHLNLAMSAELESEALLSRLTPLLPPDWEATGTVPLSLSLEGTGKELRAELRADLTPLSLETAQGPVKATGERGRLLLAGRMTPGQWLLTEGEVDLPVMAVRARGEIDRNAAGTFRLALDIPPFELSPLQERLPLLQRLKLHGRIGLKGELSGSGGRIEARRGTVSLQEVGLHLGRVVADLSAVSGTISINNDEAVFDRLRARLGSSPIRVSGRLDDFAAPQLKLHVRAKSIRADEVIFPSDQAFLRDIDGHLSFSAEGIRFEPVTVRLDGGTRAKVTGTVEGFSNPRVLLDISADHGNIDEVIALWQHSGPNPPPPAAEEGAGATTVITVRAREGTISGLRFQDAQGTITFHRGLLAIHPLHFRSGAGYGVGSVVSDNRPGSPPLLKISSHLEDFDAAAVYSDLLRQRGLLMGTLRGDFYLEGKAGKEFLSTSLGAFNLEIHDGVLRKFNSLAKMFSILNVSQIFAFQLPDMSSKGMPFTTLSANVLLQKGVLSTEDLFVDSNAMNLSAIGTLDLQRDHIDLILGVKPLRTVDKIITKIPIAGWLLTGKEKALITAHFQIRGNSADPEVVPIPITSLSEKVIGVFKRVFGLPGKIISDFGEAFEGDATN